MKYIRIFFACYLAVWTLACQKEVPQPSQPVPGIPSHFSGLQVNAGFDWSTFKEISLQFEGYQAPVALQKSLVVKVQGETNPILTVLQPIQQSSQFVLRVPASASYLEITYGGLTKTIQVQTNMIFSPKPTFE